MEKINLVAEFNDPFMSTYGWDRRKYVNIEAFALNGYSRGILKEIPYINPRDWTIETTQKITKEMVDTFKFYKEIDKDFDYELNHTYIRKPKRRY